MTCMDCGGFAELRESEPDRYREYGDDPRAHEVLWAYCKKCDCWTQSGLSVISSPAAGSLTPPEKEKE